MNNDLREKLEKHLALTAKEFQINFEEMNILNDHIHTLLLLPSDKSIGQIAKSLKGESSHWSNEERLVRNRFSWQRGYGAFSVSASQLRRVKSCIRNQSEHHRKKTFAEEYDEWLNKYENSINR